MGSREAHQGPPPSARAQRFRDPLDGRAVEAREAPDEELTLSLFDRIWREAGSAFSKRNGEPVALTPYSRTWKTILERAEHALWVWNDKYGPLTAEQREYAGDLICHALKKAGAQEAVGDRYAFFHTELTSMLNHERVHEGFQRRGASLDDALDVDIFKEVVA